MTTQPFLSDLTPLLCAPVQVWAHRTGDIGAPDGSPMGAQGIYHFDYRVLRTATLSVTLTHDGVEHEVLLEHLTTRLAGSNAAKYVLYPRLDGAVPDPKILITRHRRVDADRVEETIAIDNRNGRGYDLTIRVRLTPADDAMAQVKEGRVNRAGVDGSAIETAESAVAEIQRTGRDDTGTAVESSWCYAGGRGRTTLAATGARLIPYRENADTGDAPRDEVVWHGHLGEGEQAEFNWSLTLAPMAHPFAPARQRGISAAVEGWIGEHPMSEPWRGEQETEERGANAARAGSHEARDVRQLLTRAAADLDALLLHDPASDSDFLAAGAPWFFTLFGRDSLIAATFLADVCPSLGVSTLRALASRQGTRRDPSTGEEPGKILHEVRAETLEIALEGESLALPPVYYGTIDATALWVRLFDRLWKASTSDDTVRRQILHLVPSLRAALDWIVSDGDRDGDGLLEYVDETGRGLSNQGWKDSGDSVRWEDGRFADGPIALCEVQGYAYAALNAGADILAELASQSGDVGVDGDVERYRRAATRLREAFATYWIEDNAGRYPAIALDRDKQPVTGVSSNIGHLLGTGLLTREDEDAVVRRLMAPDMLTTFGVRTLSSTHHAFHPLSYHCGSIWAHDNAMIVDAMMHAGYREEAATIARRLLELARAYRWRLPELAGGDGVEGEAPLPYPASCFPQAWAAASAVVIARALA